MATEERVSSSSEDRNTELYEKERWYGHTAALSFGLFFILVGVPIWWMTTTVYRAELPYSEIKKAFQITPTLGAEIELVVVSDGVGPVDMAQFGELIQDTFIRMNSRDDYIALKYRGSLRAATSDELKLFSSVSSREDLENVPQPKDDKYMMYIVPGKFNAMLTKPFINSHRDIFIPSSSDLSKLSDIIPTLELVCDELFRPSALSRTFQVVHGAPLNDKELLRSVRFDSSYTIVFSLLVPEPNKVLATWDMSSAVDEYLSQLKSSLDEHIDLKIKSQVLYYETLSIKAKRNDADGYNYINPSDMPHLINPIEARLGSFVDTNPTLNFIVYVPTEKQYPLHLHDDQGKILTSSSFLVPRWGGFYIYNVNTSSSAHPVLHQVDVGVVFTQLLPQIRALLGFTALSTNSVLERTAASDSSLSQWELYQWMQQKTIENIGTSTHTLYSLSKLVQNIRNMVINDDISKQVTESVRAIINSHSLLSRGSITEAYTASKYSLQCADKAFFDTSLLELLYFPEDQKFAIYIPLFLPVGIPLLFSTIAAIKWFKGPKVTADAKLKAE